MEMFVYDVYWKTGTLYFPPSGHSYISRKVVGKCCYTDDNLGNLFFF